MFLLKYCVGASCTTLVLDLIHTEYLPPEQHSPHHHRPPCLKARGTSLFRGESSFDMVNSRLKLKKIHVFSDFSHRKSKDPSPKKNVYIYRIVFGLQSWQPLLHYIFDKEFI